MCTTVLACIGAAPLRSLAQGGFQIVWVNVGEVATADAAGNARAGRRLFDAGDLASLTLANVRIGRVEVEPATIRLHVGQQWCLTSLAMHAFGPDRQFVPAAPLSITVRQDHREHIGLRRSRKDICVRPVSAGEYPVRFTSLLPAPDGSMRGAQIFITVVDAAAALDDGGADAQAADRRRSVVHSTTR